MKKVVGAEISMVSSSGSMSDFVNDTNEVIRNIVANSGGSYRTIDLDSIRVQVTTAVYEVLSERGRVEQKIVHYATIFYQIVDMSGEGDIQPVPNINLT